MAYNEDNQAFLYHREYSALLLAYQRYRPRKSAFSLCSLYRIYKLQTLPGTDPDPGKVLSKIVAVVSNAKDLKIPDMSSLRRFVSQVVILPYLICFGAYQEYTSSASVLWPTSVTVL